jgi:hypothetical protein
VEPVGSGKGGRLAVACESVGAVSINGRPCPRLTLMAERDALCAGDQRLHLSRFVKPYAGPTPAHLAGKPCTVCQLPLEADSRVLVCAHCGAAQHDESGLDDRPGDERLECADLTTTCPTCQQRLYREEGFTFVPEELAIDGHPG